jgi:hypothetical protein
MVATVRPPTIAAATTAMIRRQSERRFTISALCLRAQVFVRDELSASVATPPNVIVIVLDAGGSPDACLKGVLCHRFEGLVVRKLNHLLLSYWRILFQVRCDQSHMQ